MYHCNLVTCISSRIRSLRQWLFGFAENETHVDRGHRPEKRVIMPSDLSNPYRPPTTDSNVAESQPPETRYKPRVGVIAMITAVTAAATVFIGDRISPGHDTIQELIISMFCAIGLSWTVGMAFYRFEQRRVIRLRTNGSRRQTDDA